MCYGVESPEHSDWSMRGHTAVRLEHVQEQVVSDSGRVAMVSVAIVSCCSREGGRGVGLEVRAQMTPGQGGGRVNLDILPIWNDDGP